MVSAEVPISETITTNKFDVWDCSKKVDKIEFTPSKAMLKKMNSACECRKIQAKEIFKYGIYNIPQSICVVGKKGLELYHGSKSDITKRFPSPTSTAPIYNPEDKLSIVLEMSPLIKAKAYSTHTSSLTNFGEFSVLMYYDVMKHAASYERIDLVFDRYFERSLKEATRLGRGEGSKYSFEGDSTEIPFKMAGNILSNSENKDILNEYLATKLLELYHQSDQMLVATHKNTSLASRTSCLELDQHVPVRPCTAEDADQRLVRHTLNMIQNGYKNILVHTIDTDVLYSLFMFLKLNLMMIL